MPKVASRVADPAPHPGAPGSMRVATPCSEMPGLGLRSPSNKREGGLKGLLVDATRGGISCGDRLGSGTPPRPEAGQVRSQPRTSHAAPAIVATGAHDKDCKIQSTALKIDHTKLSLASA